MLRAAVLVAVALSSAPEVAQPGINAQGTPPVRVGSTVRSPTKIKDAQPTYPAEAQRNGIQGVVILEITIDAMGKVTRASVLRSIPFLDAAAVDAVRKWEYEPTILNGVPVPVIVTVTVNFAMQPPVGAQPRTAAGSADTVVPPAAAQMSTLTQQVRAGRALTPAQAADLEEQLKTSPTDMRARVSLLGYYFATAARVEGVEAAKAARRRHILWVIEHAPEDQTAMLSEMTIDPAGHSLADPEGYAAAKARWKALSDDPKSGPIVLRHAAYFFRLHDKALALDCLKRAQTSLPATAELGAQYAITILGITMINSNGLPMVADATEAGGDLARRAAGELRASTNLTLLELAGNMLAQYGAVARALTGGAIDRDALTEEILLKVQSLAPANFAAPKALAEMYKRRALASTDRGTLARQWLTEATMAADRAAAASDNASFIADWRLSLRLDAARAAVEAGETEAAKTMAEAALAQVTDEHSVKFGQAVHDGHAVLGRAALAKGNVEEAKSQLLRAAQVAGGGTLTSFGPNMSLAKELVERGERDTVVKYLDQCRSFWKNARLDDWIRTIQEGKTPNFGANLLY
jgi:TonB family protein